MHGCETHYRGTQKIVQSSFLETCICSCSMCIWNVAMGPRYTLRKLLGQYEKLKECLIFCNRWAVFVEQLCIQFQRERLRHAYVAEVPTASQEPRNIRLPSQQATLHLGMAQLPSVSPNLTGSTISAVVLISNASQTTFKNSKGSRCYAMNWIPYRQSKIVKLYLECCIWI